MNVLYINTSNSKEILIKITKGDELFEEKEEYETPRADSVIFLLQKALEKANLTPQEIDSIKVEEGPGSYTGLRVGVSIANALAFVLQRSVNDKKIGQFAVPIYEKN